LHFTGSRAISSRVIETGIWRALGRDAELAHSLGGVAGLLAGDVPLRGVAVGRLDVTSRRLVVIAADWIQPPRHAPQPSRRWTDLQLDDLLTWHRAGAPLQGAPDQDPLLKLLWPVAEPTEVAAWPLQDEGHDPGVLLFFAEPERLRPEHRGLLSRMVEPFGMALVNDRRLEEVKRLREALEADKRALLTRLDRDNIVDTVVGADAGLAELMERVKQVAPTDVPVLLFGETGSGKEVVARVIHAQSNRRSNTIVRVNCGAIPPGLVDSDLFGHERGSFTGAVATRLGWFERASGGTLFLDEVGELPLEAQVRLLRVLQEGTIERVGGTRTIHVDVRIVAATNRDLREMVSRGAFREDLWYRLSVFPLHLPPLRDRPHDLPELAVYFAARAGKRLGGAPLSLSGDDVAILLDYSWPGNVRELAAVIERAAILGDGKRLELRSALGAPATAHGSATESGFPTLDEVVQSHVEAALRRAHGRIEGDRGAARLLGLNPFTLRSRMRKMGIDWAGFRAGSAGH
jgi:transcriptional regulator with GAF, ATPase, and Fis domain